MMWESLQALFQWDFKVKAIFELCGHSSCEIKGGLVIFFFPFAVQNNDTNKLMFQEVHLNAVIHTQSPLFPQRRFTVRNMPS